MSKKLLPSQEKFVKKVIASLKKGKVPWRKPWNENIGLMYNGATGRVYRGSNQALLQMFAEMANFNDPRWATWQQIQEKGWRIKKGAVSSTIFSSYWEDPETREKVTREQLRSLPKEEAAIISKRMRIRYKPIVLFNGDQITGISKLAKKDLITFQLSDDRISRLIDTASVSMNLQIKKDATARAAYIPQLDIISIPPEDAFFSLEDFHGTLLHEMGHATGHQKRLNRELSGDKYSKVYAKEELVAELTSGLAALEIGMNIDNLQDNNSAYIKHWIEKLEEQPEALMEALGKAVKAKDYLLDQMDFSIDYEKLSKNLEPQYRGEHGYYWDEIGKLEFNRAAPIVYIRANELPGCETNKIYSLSEMNNFLFLSHEETTGKKEIANCIVFYPQKDDIKSIEATIDGGHLRFIDALKNLKILQKDEMDNFIAYLNKHESIESRIEQNNIWIGNLETAPDPADDVVKPRLEYLRAVNNWSERCREDINQGREFAPEPKIDRYLNLQGKEKTLSGKNKGASLDAIKSNIPITEYAAMSGYSLKRVGRNIFSLLEHDSCMIYTDRNDFMRFSTGKGGSIIDFIMEFEGLELKDAIAKAKQFAIDQGIDLSDANESVVTTPKQKRESLSIDKDFPKPFEDNAKIIEYLTKVRGIDMKVVKEYINSGMLYEDSKNNCVFVNYENDVPTYGFIRGTVADFKQEVACESSSGFYYSRGSSVLVITEGIIDAMSHQCLSEVNYDYLSVGGTQKGIHRFDILATKGYLEGIEKVIVAFDNDDAGLKAGTALAQHIRDDYPGLKVCAHVPEGKDFNDDLIKEQGISDAAFLKYEAEHRNDHLIFDDELGNEAFIFND